MEWQVDVVARWTGVGAELEEAFGLPVDKAPFPSLASSVSHEFVAWT